MLTANRLIGFATSPLTSLRQMASKGRFLTACGVLVLGMALGASTGCDAVKAIQGQQEIIAQIQAERDDLSRQSAKIAAFVAQADKQQAATAQREQAIRQSMSQVSQQLASATGPAFDSLARTLADLQAQLRQAQDQHAAAAEQAASAAALSAQVTAQIAATDDALAQGQQRLEALQEALASRTQGISGMIRQAGEIAQQYGVPGAAPIAGTTADMLGGLLGIVFGVGATGVVAKRKIDQATATSQQYVTAATELAESVQLARNTDPQFAAALQGKAGEILKGYQGEVAKTIVAQAKIAIPTTPIITNGSGA